MLNRKFLRVIPLAVLGCLACNQNPDALREDLEAKANRIAQQVKEQVQALPDAEQVKQQIDRLMAAVELKDLQTLKDACGGVDGKLGTRVLSKYNQAFSLEVQEGPPRVMEYLNSEINKLGDGDAEKAALIGLRNYFEAKGTLTTRDAAVLILLVALEAKFPHGRGTIFLAPFLGDPKSDGAATKSAEP